MSILVSRRITVIGGLATLVASGIVLAGSPVGAAPNRPAIPSAGKTVDAGLSLVSVAPHSASAWALGSETITKGTTATTSIYALRSKGGGFAKVKVVTPAEGTVSAIAAASPKSAYLAGYSDASGESPVVEHSTGGSFKIMKTKLPAGALSSISASSSSNVWVGGSTTASGVLLAHLHGHSWKRVKFPKSHSSDSIYSISTSSPSNVWILGAGLKGVEAEHWNGHSLKFTKLPIPAAGGVSVHNISSSSAKSAWIVGSQSKVKGTTTITTVVSYRWNGHKWSLIKVPASKDFSPQGISSAGTHAFIAGASGKVVKKGLQDVAVALTFKGGHWHNAKVAKSGLSSSFVSISESTKATVAVGTSYNGLLCSTHYPHLRASPLLEVAHGGSFGHHSAPSFRTGSAALRFGSASPDIRSC